MMKKRFQSFSSVAIVAVLAFFSVCASRGQTLLVSFGSDATVEKVSTSGADLGTFANFLNGLQNPTGLAFDSSGNVYVVNSLGSGLGFIEKFSASGTDLGVFASGLHSPQGLVIDTSNNVYVANAETGFNNIAKYSSSGGSPLVTFTATGLIGPAGLAIDSGGNIYAANLGGNTVEKFTSSGSSLGSIGSAANLHSPAGLAFDSGGNLYVANSNGGTIATFNSSGSFVGNFVSTGLGSIGGLAFAPSGDLYVTSNTDDKIAAYTSAGSLVAGFPLSVGSQTSPAFVAVVSAIPEPSVYGSIVGTLTLIFAVERRRRRQAIGN